MKKILFLLVISCQLSVVNAQLSMVDGQTEKKISKENVMSGSLAIDSKIAFDKSEKIISISPDNINVNKKSIWLAVGLSALLPGAGEFYSESYIKSAAFIAVEAAAITLGLIYNKKGNDQTILFQNYADDVKNGWSVYRYANWTLANAKKLNPYINIDDFNGKVIKPDGTVDWVWLNKLESAVSFSSTAPVLGSYYSHNLPPRGSQQYYELIGKYQQFNVGWAQFGDDVNSPFVYGDPLVPQFTEYTALFYQADKYYNVASQAVIVVIINHIVSALDAAWTANSYNKNLVLNASLERRDYGYITVYYPQLNLQYRF